MEKIFRSEPATVDESTLMYRNPLGVKAGRNKIITGVVMSLIAAALVGVGVWFMIDGDVPLGSILIVATAAYAANCGMQIAGGIKLMKRPYAVIIDGKNLILREKTDCLHLPLTLMRRLTIYCEGIEAQLVVNQNGKYDITVKGETMYYAVDGEQKNFITSRNMRKVAFILNGIALGKEPDTNWGARYDELMLSPHVEAEGAAAGLNKELDKVAASYEEQSTVIQDGETNETAEEVSLPQENEKSDSSENQSTPQTKIP